MKLIAHRGNINGRDLALENTPTYIDQAIHEGYDVEVDVWSETGILFLGHDRPEHEVSVQWFEERSQYLWIHCKNVSALEFFSKSLSLYNFFWHESDTATLTSKGFIWVYPGKQPIANSIAVMPELNNDDVSNCLTVCSDEPYRYKELFVN